MPTYTATLSFQSLDNLLAKVRQYQTDFIVKVNNFMERLVEYGVNEASKYFNEGVTVSSVQIDENTWAVVAQGEQVCFIEFGAGVWAGYGHEYAATAPIKVYPGSWSEEHQKTWQAWNEAGKDPYAYRYNRVPRYGLLTAYNAMKDAAPRIAKEVFR